MATLKRLFQTLGFIHVLRYSSRGDRLWGWIAEKVEPRFGAFPRLGALLPDWVKLPAPHAQLLPSFMDVVLAISGLREIENTAPQLATSERTRHFRGI